MSRVHRYLIPHSLTLGWPVMESKSVQRQMSSEPVMSKNSRHTLTINIYIFYCSYLTLHTVMDWRTLTPSDILTDCIYPDNYSLCIICTNNHLIISHPRVKSVLFRLHPPVISSFIQTHVTFETLIRGLIVEFMRRQALDTVMMTQSQKL